MPISLITFDLDNTLWDVLPTLLRAEKIQNEWLALHRPGATDKYDQDELLSFKKTVWKRNPHLAHNMSKMRAQTLYELQIAAGYSEEQSLSGAEEAFAVFLNERHKVQLYADALEVLAKLAKKYTLGVLTNGNADVYKTDAGEHFDFAYLAEDIGVSKPHPDIFQAALDKANAKAENVVHVGDDPEHDIHGANNIGMHTVWMNNYSKPWPDAYAAPDFEISNLRQLPDLIATLARR